MFIDYYITVRINSDVGIVVGVFILAIFILIFFVLTIIRHGKLGDFKSNIRIERDRIVLPSILELELGRVILDYYKRGKCFELKININPVKKITTDTIILDELCNSGFYAASSKSIFQGPWLHINAPGFRVIKEPYSGIVGLCLDPSKIPVKRVELNIKSEYSGEVVGEVMTNNGGFTGKVNWIYRVTRTPKVVFDEKSGVYRVIEDYTSKSRARSVRLEVCGEVDLAKKKCLTIVENYEPNKEIYGKTRILEERKIVFTLEGCTTCLKDIEQLISDSLLGYAEGKIKAKLVVDIPMGEDVISEVEI